jgi:hypothetical protein
MAPRLCSALSPHGHGLELCWRGLVGQQRDGWGSGGRTAKSCIVQYRKVEKAPAEDRGSFCDSSYQNPSV